MFLHNTQEDKRFWAERFFSSCVQCC